VTPAEMPPDLTGQERHEQIEGWYQRDRDRYLARLDREDRHTPAPRRLLVCDTTAGTGTCSAAPLAESRLRDRFVPHRHPRPRRTQGRHL
jgi:hypothetical protein